VDPDGRETNPITGQANILDNQILNSSSNPSKGEFGFVRNGGTKFHSGVDLAGSKGTPLLAPVSGRAIQSAKTNGDGGNVIRIERDTKTEGGKSVYIHMSHLNSGPPVKVGEIVVEGKIKVGETGNSGNAKGEPSQVHLSVYVGGQTAAHLMPPKEWFKENPPKSDSAAPK
jgi:peptidoglycan LD-endopeptidase LytH